MQKIEKCRNCGHDILKETEEEPLGWFHCLKKHTVPNTTWGQDLRYIRTAGCVQPGFTCDCTWPEPKKDSQKFTQFIIRDEVYSIRKVCWNDRYWIYNLMTDEEIRKNFYSPKEITWEEHKAYWKKKLGQKTFRATAILKQKSWPVGLIRLDEEDISIAIKPGYQRQGIAFEALSRIDLSKSVASIKPSNKASKRLFKKLGVKMEIKNTGK